MFSAPLWPSLSWNTYLYLLAYAMFVLIFMNIISVYQNNFYSDQSKPKRSWGAQTERKGNKLRTQPKRLCVQANSKEPISLFVANTPDSNDRCSDAHTEEHIPLSHQFRHLRLPWHSLLSLA